MITLNDERATVWSSVVNSVVNSMWVSVGNSVEIFSKNYVWNYFSWVNSVDFKKNSVWDYFNRAKF